MKLLPVWNGRDVPDGGELGGRISAVDEVVIEGMAGSATFARPEERLVGVGKGGVECVRRRVWLRPCNLVNDLAPHRLQSETEAEDDVVGAGDPDGAVGFEDAARLLQPPDVELVILREPHGPVPGTLVHRGEPAALERNAASGEPVRRIGEDHLNAARGYDLHEMHTVGEVHNGPRLAERLQVPQFHTTILGSSSRRL